MSYPMAAQTDITPALEAQALLLEYVALPESEWPVQMYGDLVRLRARLEAEKDLEF